MSPQESKLREEFYQNWRQQIFNSEFSPISDNVPTAISCEKIADFFLFFLSHRKEELEKLVKEIEFKIRKCQSDCPCPINNIISLIKAKI